MKIREINNPESIGESDSFNIHGLSEIIVYYADGSATSDFIKEYEVYLESSKQWINMLEAFASKQLISDNYNEYFREPLNDEEKTRGYYG